jgi:16S rRNA (uracil1498-N3)-methyltransferase
VREKRRVFHAELDGENATLSPEESHHLTRVLRAKEGELLELFDGAGHTREGRIEEIRSAEVQVVFTGEKCSRERVSPWVTLAVAPPKGQRMDDLVQMAQEIGLDELIPLVTKRAVERRFSEKRYERWQRIAVAAAKQSGADFLIQFNPVVSLETLVGSSRQWDLRLVFHKGPGCVNLSDFLDEQPQPERILLTVGPEGGFTEEEVALVRDSGFMVVSLPAHTLRVETAAVFALSAVCCRFRETARANQR